MDDVMYYESFDRERNRVPKTEALEYAMERCGIPRVRDKPLDQEFSAMLVEWYFSDWCPVYQEEGEKTEWL